MRFFALLVTLSLQAVVARADLDAQARAMLDPIREEALRPRELIARLRLPPTAVIADIGAGPGFLAIPIARAVPRGVVIATDIRREYLDVLSTRAKEAKLTNVQTRLVESERPGLDTKSIDVALLCQVDHYLKDRTAYLTALLPALRPGGRMVLVNYNRFREADLTAARQAGLRVVDEWTPSVAFFMIALSPGKN